MCSSICRRRERRVSSGPRELCGPQHFRREPSGMVARPAVHAVARVGVRQRTPARDWRQPVARGLCPLRRLHPRADDNGPAMRLVQSRRQRRQSEVAKTALCGAGPSRHVEEESGVPTRSKSRPPWERQNPKKASSSLSHEQKRKAKARARAAGRTYPNLVDNMAAAKKRKTQRTTGRNAKSSESKRGGPG